MSRNLKILITIICIYTAITTTAWYQYWLPHDILRYMMAGGLAFFLIIGLIITSQRSKSDEQGKKNVILTLGTRVGRRRLRI